MIVDSGWVGLVRKCILVGKFFDSPKVEWPVQICYSGSIYFFLINGRKSNSDILSAYFCAEFDCFDKYN